MRHGLRKRVLVTGGAGFLGAHLCARLLANGHDVVLTAAADKARSLLGWQPRHTDLPEILRHAWNWHSKHAQPPGNEPRAQPVVSPARI